MSNFCFYLFICLYDLKVLSDKVMSGQSANQVSLFLKAVNHLYNLLKAHSFASYSS